MFLLLEKLLNQCHINVVCPMFDQLWCNTSLDFGLFMLDQWINEQKTKLMLDFLCLINAAVLGWIFHVVRLFFIFSPWSMLYGRCAWLFLLVSAKYRCFTWMHRRTKSLWISSKSTIWALLCLLDVWNFECFMYAAPMFAMCALLESICKVGNQCNGLHVVSIKKVLK